MQIEILWIHLQQLNSINIVKSQQYSTNTIKTILIHKTIPNVLSPNPNSKPEGLVLKLCGDILINIADY